MQAVISGRSGVALLLEGNQLRSLHAGTGEIVSRREREVPYLLGDATDLQFLANVEIPEVTRHLEVATAQADALHLALMLLDPELPLDVRRDAADELTELCEIKGAREYVEGVLLSHPLPKESDLPGALSCCPRRAKVAREILQRVQNLQGSVEDVFFAWEQIPERVFEEPRNRSFALATAIREGFFRELVLRRTERLPLDEFFMEAVRNTTFSRVQNHREILRTWIEPLRESKQASRPPLFDREDLFVAENAPPRAEKNEQGPSLGSHQGWTNFTPEELYQRYYRPVVAFFAKRGFLSEESRDLAQETFLRVYKRLEEFRSDSSLETWLFQIANNLYKNALRSQLNQKRDASEVSLETPEGRQLEEARDNRDEATLGTLPSKEREKIFREALEDLPPQMRQAVLLRVDKDLKYSEIAELMHISIETVKKHLYQARQHLRDRLRSND